MAEDLVLSNDGVIRELIFEVRGRHVILDSNVAMLYQYETKRINETVRRNKERFPDDDFCFQLSQDEYQLVLSSKLTTTNENNGVEILRSQFATASNKKRNDRYLPYVFTEQGIAMLSGLLKSTIAVETSINIIKAFVLMRKFLVNNQFIFERLTTVEYKLIEHDNKFNQIFNFFANDKEIKQKIFFDGQIYDAYSLIIDIIKKAKQEIIIIDNYIDKTVLDILSKKKNNVNVIIIGKNNLNLSKIDIDKFNKQYPKLTLKISDKYHDRFIIIDNKTIYHLGASLKDLGLKCFAINIMEDISLVDKI